MIDKYVTYLRDVRRYSPRTVTLYGDALRAFAQWAQTPGQAGGDLIGHLIPSRIREYEGHLIDTGLKPRTVHLHMSALSGFCGFLMKEGVLKSNPAKAVKRPKMEKRLPEYYTEQAMDTYLTESAHEADTDELQVLLSTAPGSKLAKELYNRRLRRLKSKAWIPVARPFACWEKGIKCEKFRSFLRYFKKFRYIYVQLVSWWGKDLPTLRSW